MTISTFGLTINQLDNFPNASDILNMPNEDFEKQTKDIEITVINTGRERETLDWEHIKDLKRQNSDFNLLFNWISKCLSDGKAYTFLKFSELMEQELREMEARLKKLKRGT